MSGAKSSLFSHLRGLQSIAPLTTAEEEQLSGMIQSGDSRALEKLVRHNLRFVVSVVKETPTWHHGSVPLEDLLAIGNEAMLKAARKWVPKNGARFVTYARPFIIKGITRALDNEWSMIRVPVNIAEEIRKMKYNERVMTQELCRDPTDAELAERLRVHVSRIADLRSFMLREPTSLESFNQEKFQEESEE